MLALWHWLSVAPGRKGLWRRLVRAEEVFDCNSADGWDDSARQNLAGDCAHNLILHLPSFLPAVLTVSPGFCVATSNWNRIARIVLEAGRNLTTKCTPCCWSCLVTKWIPLQIDRRLLPSSSGLCHQPASRVPTASFIKTGMVGYTAAPGVLLVWSWLSYGLFWTERGPSWWKGAPREESRGGSPLSTFCSIFGIKGWFRKKRRVEHWSGLHRLVLCGSWHMLVLLGSRGWRKS